MTVRMLPLALNGLIFAASVSQAAELPKRSLAMEIAGSAYVFPSSANVQGVGAYFKTRVALTNPTSSPMTVLATLSTLAGAVPSKEIALSPFETRLYENFLDEVFGFTGGGGIGLSVQGTEAGTLSRPVLAIVEVYVDGLSGRYSTPVTGLFAGDMVVRPAVEAGYSIVSGLRANASNRANFGCSNADSVPVVVRAEFFTSSTPLTGTPAAVEELSLGAGGWGQRVVPVQGEVIRVLFSVKSGGATAGVYCYGVNVNNASNDGTSIPAAYVPQVD